jgi:hypothetical protein
VARLVSASGQGQTKSNDCDEARRRLQFKPTIQANNERKVCIPGWGEPQWTKEAERKQHPTSKGTIWRRIVNANRPDWISEMCGRKKGCAPQSQRDEGYGSTGVGLMWNYQSEPPHGHTLVRLAILIVGRTTRLPKVGRSVA